MNQPTHADIGLDISPGITVGVELERFEKVKNWKRYVGSILCPYLKGDVLEIGAGRGNNTEFLSIAQYSSWTFLEPDSVLYQVLAHRITALNNPLLRTHQGTIQDLSPHQRFDSILYIDVLEHIKEHQAEIASATLRLQRNGYLIVLSPAHQFLYSPFDQAVGHYRRYTKQSLSAVINRDVEIVQLLYLDCMGLLASLANRLFLKQSLPSERQLKLWDSTLSLSRKLDPRLGFRFGKSVLLIGKKKSL